MRVGTQSLPVTARIAASQRRTKARAAVPGAPAPSTSADRVEISGAAARVAATESLGTAVGRTPEQVRELVGRVNREAARNAETADLDALRRAMG